MKMKVGVMGVLAALSIGACGGEEEGAGDLGEQPTTSTAAAVSSVYAADSLLTAMAEGDGPGVAGGVYTLGSVASSIVVAQPVAPQEGTARVGSPRLVGTCDCTAGVGCTFDGCGDEGGNFSVDGAIVIEGDRYDIDLVVNIVYGGQEWAWNYVADLTRRAHGFGGWTHGFGWANLDAEKSVEWHWGLTLTDLEIEANGCPIAGQADAAVYYQVWHGIDDGKAYWGEGSASFGPACGDVAIVDSGEGYEWHRDPPTWDL